MIRGRAGGILVLVVAACSSGERASSTDTGATETAALGGAVAARVGGEALPLSLVAEVAKARRLSAREAAQKVIDDEIAASSARARGLDRTAPAAWKLVAARGRFTSERILEEAKRRGPPTDEEVRFLSERHWVEVDRPPAVHVVHAIVLRPETPALAPRARALAEELRAALADTPTAELDAKVKAFPHDPALKTRVEALPAFTNEGRVTEGQAQMDPAFAKGAFAIAEVGGTSPVVESSFGFHVIRLVEKLPEKRMPVELRRLAFAEEVTSLRARESLTRRLQELRAASPVSIAPAAEALMRAVSVGAEASRDPSGAP